MQKTSGEMVVTYKDSDEALKRRIAVEWGDKAARHMHLSNGFSIVALHGEMPVGLISIQWKKLPPPLSEVFDGYIDILEVHRDFRRKGIATQLINMATDRAKSQGAHQMRAWSSDDKIEAIPMWKALGYGLCPATTYPKGQSIEGYFVAKPL